jgi:hypothetical protein
MKVCIPPLCFVLVCAVNAFSKLGVNCGEHSNLLRDQSGIVWFSPDQMEKITTRRIEPALPQTPSVSHYDGYVTFKVLVDQNGDIACIWNGTGKAPFVQAVNVALQYWRFKPKLMDGAPVEFVGVVKFKVHAN